ncbi:MAG: hypothetical protein KAU90_12235, partial [Sulfurovaceae bacterium]|nr:hypothetical protein [Sulfurovaceae bacterium]
MYDSIYYDTLKNINGFQALSNTDEGKKLLKKLYIDVLCVSEIGGRNGSKDIANNIESEVSLHFEYNNESIDEKYFNEVEIINNFANCFIKDDVHVLYQENEQKKIYRCVNNNEKYAFIPNSFDKKEAKDGYEFKINNKIIDYLYCYANFKNV